MISTLPELTSYEVSSLINSFDKNLSLKELPYRKFGLDISKALEIVSPLIDSVLGKHNWVCTGGNFFETSYPYRVHADTGKENFDKNFQTFVFPLSYELEEDANLELNRLIILNQSWNQGAAFFLKGTANAQPEYNDVITDYSKVENLSIGFDKDLVEMCSHLNPSNLEGLSIDQSFVWTPGVPITFPRNRLHVASNFLKAGVRKKLGLSIFTSHPDQ